MIAFAAKRRKSKFWIILIINLIQNPLGHLSERILYAEKPTEGCFFDKIIILILV